MDRPPALTGELHGEPAFVFAHSTGKQAFAVALTVVATAGVAVAAVLVTPWLWLVVALFAVRIALFLRRGGTPTRFGLTPTGVVLDDRRLPWEAIDAIDVIDPLKRGRMKLVRVRAGTDFAVVDPSTFALRHHAMVALLRRYREAPELRPRIGTADELATIAAWSPESPTRT